MIVTRTGAEQESSGDDRDFVPSTACVGDAVSSMPTEELDDMERDGRRRGEGRQDMAEGSTGRGQSVCVSADTEKCR